MKNPIVLRTASSKNKNIVYTLRMVSNALFSQVVVEENKELQLTFYTPSCSLEKYSDSIAKGTSIRPKCSISVVRLKEAISLQLCLFNAFQEATALSFSK